jgi:glutathionyl-hydroquinone reductase
LAQNIPKDLRPEVDGRNARIDDTLNIAVYRAGFATTQSAPEEAVAPLLDTLNAYRVTEATSVCSTTLA